MNHLLPELKKKLPLYSISLGLATSSLISFNSWLITPNYNSLNLQSLLMCGVGFLFAKKEFSQKSIFGWLCIGFGGALTFMAKPSSALGLALITPIYLMISQKFSARLLSLSIITAFVVILMSALIIDGSVSDFSQRLKLGFEFARTLGGGHNLVNLLRIDQIQLNQSILFISLIFFLTTYFAAWALSIKKYLFIYFLIVIGYFIVTFVALTNNNHAGFSLGQFQGLIIFSIIISILFTGLGCAPFSTLNKIGVPEKATACLFAFMPYLYAFGTSNNYWITGSSAGIFWLLSSLFCLIPKIHSTRNLDPLMLFTLATQTVIALLLHSGVENPYRQMQPLWLNSSITEIRPHQSKLILSDDYAKYISDIRSSAQVAKFQTSIPVIDLTGQSPGLIFILEAKSLGQAWILGGYSGSYKVAAASLALASCEEIAEAWILYEKNGPLSIPVELINKLGGNFPAEYKKVGEWQTPIGAGGFAYSRHQELYAPLTTNNTMVTCRYLRSIL
jgi:fumarate reductase subunit D